MSVARQTLMALVSKDSPFKKTCKIVMSTHLTPGFRFYYYRGIPFVLKQMFDGTSILMDFKNFFVQMIERIRFLLMCIHGLRLGFVQKDMSKLWIPQFLKTWKKTTLKHHDPLRPSQILPGRSFAMCTDLLIQLCVNISFHFCSMVFQCICSKS